MSQLSNASDSDSEYSDIDSEIYSEYTDTEGSLADFIVHDTDTTNSDYDYSSDSSQSTICDSETYSLKTDDEHSQSTSSSNRSG